MKWVSWREDAGVRTGVLATGDDGAQVVHPHSGSETLLDLIATDVLGSAGDAALGGPSVPLDGLAVVEPFRPPSMRDSMCFHEHIRNCALDGTTVAPLHSQFPTFYFSNPQAVIGPFDDVPIAPGSERWDYELEVAAVVGRPGHNIAPADAESHIAGYTIYIDWSARDVQFIEMDLRLGPAKGKDTATTLGPVFVTKDELEPYRKAKGFDLGMTVTVNGARISTGNWSSIDWTFSDVIAYTSRGTGLVPGDVLGSGTVGWGCLFEHFQTQAPTFPGWLKAGDVVEMHVDGIGDTRQTVVTGDVKHPLSSGW